MQTSTLYQSIDDYDPDLTLDTDIATAYQNGKDEIMAAVPPPRPLRRALERLLRRQLHRRPL